MLPFDAYRFMFVCSLRDYLVVDLFWGGLFVSFVFMCVFVVLRYASKREEL